MYNSKRIKDTKTTKTNKENLKMKSLKKLSYELIPTDNRAIIEFDDLLR